MSHSNNRTLSNPMQYTYIITFSFRNNRNKSIDTTSKTRFPGYKIAPPKPFENPHCPFSRCTRQFNRNQHRRPLNANKIIQRSPAIQLATSPSADFQNDLFPTRRARSTWHACCTFRAITAALAAAKWRVVRAPIEPYRARAAHCFIYPR